ncbi:MAG TPA: TIGR03086 family metal-binding protein [Acidimicrobiales bacterium]|jgi:uncharacterized protein (TIGR03086 family)|nr:TIGR03086 family metal-binding protein [Acidimicrobiales bacterium]
MSTHVPATSTEIGLLAIAGQEFRSRLTKVGSGHCRLITPCEGWSVRELVHHVVAGNRRAVHRLGEAEASMLDDSEFVGGDPLDSFDRSMSKQVEAFSLPDALGRSCETAARTMTGRELLHFRILDLVVHAWDLARALGIDETLSPEVVAQTWDLVAPQSSVLGLMGVFGSGSSGTLPAEASLQNRLLDVTGRRP